MRQCDYDLAGLGSPERCPECGTTEWQSVTEPADWSGAERLNFYVALTPLAWLTVVHINLVLARLELGRWPNRFGADDPKTIPLVHHVHDVINLMLLLLPVAILVNMFLVGQLVVMAGVRHSSPRPPIMALLIAFALWLACGIIGAWDPAQVVVWFLD